MSDEIKLPIVQGNVSKTLAYAISKEQAERILELAHGVMQASQVPDVWMAREIINILTGGEDD